VEENARIPEATELVYVPEPSWVPIFIGVGLAALVIGLFAGLVWAIIGAIVLIVAFAVWTRRLGHEVSRMPRTQQISSAVIPPIPPRQRG
jgi:hypothetical protein